MRALRHVTSLVSIAALAAGCGSTQQADEAPLGPMPWTAGLDGCVVSKNGDDGRTLNCGQAIGAVALAKKEDGEALITAFLDGMGKGADATVESEPSDQEIAGVVAAGRHAWFTNKNGVSVEGWLGVVTAGGDRRLIGCFLVGEVAQNRCLDLLVVLRNAPLSEPGIYPVDVLGTHAPAPDGCSVVVNRAMCGDYELQWYAEAQQVPVEKFIEGITSTGSTLSGRSPVPCKAGAARATCEKVSFTSEAGNVDVFFAHPASGGVMLCIVEQDTGLQPMCRAFFSVEAAAGAGT